MGNSKGRDNTKKRLARRKKTERLALAKENAGSGQTASQPPTAASRVASPAGA